MFFGCELPCQGFDLFPQGMDIPAWVKAEISWDGSAFFRCLGLCLFYQKCVRKHAVGCQDRDQAAEKKSGFLFAHCQTIHQ